MVFPNNQLVLHGVKKAELLLLFVYSGYINMCIGISTGFLCWCTVVVFYIGFFYY